MLLNNFNWLFNIDLYSKRVLDSILRYITVTLIDCFFYCAEANVLCVFLELLSMVTFCEFFIVVNPIIQCFNVSFQSLLSDWLTICSTSFVLPSEEKLRATEKPNKFTEYIHYNENFCRYINVMHIVWAAAISYSAITVDHKLYFNLRVSNLPNNDVLTESVFYGRFKSKLQT